MTSATVAAAGEVLTLSSADAEVWPEVQLADGRWLAFDPVPAEEADARGASAARTASADPCRAPATDRTTARTRQRDGRHRRGRHHRVDQRAVDGDHVGDPRTARPSVCSCSRSLPPPQSSRGSSTGADAGVCTPPCRRSGSAVHGRRPPTLWSTPGSTSASRRPTARSSAQANRWSRTHVAISTGWQHCRAPRPTAPRNTPTCWPRMQPGASAPSRSRWRPIAPGGNGSGGGSACAPCVRRRAHPSPSDATPPLSTPCRRNSGRHDSGRRSRRRCPRHRHDGHRGNDENASPSVTR